MLWVCVNQLNKYWRYDLMDKMCNILLIKQCVYTSIEPFTVLIYWHWCIHCRCTTSNLIYVSVAAFLFLLLLLLLFRRLRFTYFIWYLQLLNVNISKQFLYLVAFTFYLCWRKHKLTTFRCCALFRVSFRMDEMKNKSSMVLSKNYVGSARWIGFKIELEWASHFDFDIMYGLCGRVLVTIEYSTGFFDVEINSTVPFLDCDPPSNAENKNEHEFFQNKNRNQTHFQTEFETASKILQIWCLNRFSKFWEIFQRIYPKNQRRFCKSKQFWP